ncbi:pyruvate, phosphate dikinase [Paenalkalicoccus suaedae]|uniref:Pyruvate, phosphate dikinase n=1 Tax=Paenalkalicoccus suaedae TaxID=2592382 RepID=A0A859FHC3_9BACI|nr:pyruvate, phosphate dikinase [Paenalkalicoccus suaedae]QKS72471.1 pyruvate, phosphate dikinase [Paenalkalicoccus suaedae]
MTTQFVFDFATTTKVTKELAGGKGANLAEMTRIGLPVPPGFTITTEACLQYDAAGRKLPDTIREQTLTALAELEAKTGKRLGDNTNPLFVSVRSGAVVSMPGMMDTVLNLGMNDDTARAFAEQTGNPRFAYDCYRRFLQMFSDVVLGVDMFYFERELEHYREQKGYKTDPELTADDWKELIQTFKLIVQKKHKQPFPEDPHEQLMLAVAAVFRSWYNDRAMIYRRVHHIPHTLGTAVNIQSMVFGNMGDTSGTGVAFTRNPSTGEATLYGEYLVNAQGEDVVAGIRTPNPIAELASAMPDVFAQFKETCERLEAHYRDMQDIEFTVEDGKLYLLQTRNGKRTAAAGVRIAVEMVREGILTREEALLRVDADQVDKLLHARIDDSVDRDVFAKGLPASPGAASGAIVFSADDAAKRAADGERVILVRPETTPDDIHGIIAAEAVLTTRGGMTSHAAVVARGMGKACVCGCEELNVGENTLSVAGETLVEGTIITLDGGTGEVYIGEAPMVMPELSDEFNELLTWADDVRRMMVRANADQPLDAKRAVEFGAEGIGLCRTEHMFMEADRIPVVREMIFAKTMTEREAALQRLEPMQEEDFFGLFEEMGGRPVTIRLLDPPLHEFLPDKEELIVRVTELGITGEHPAELTEKRRLLSLVSELEEKNPMLGHRGCRLGMTHPEIYAMQARAIFKAAVRSGAVPEVMIPLVGHVNELAAMRAVVEEEAARVEADQGVTLTYTVGTMIEVPRAAITADVIAAEADFFSFGTNDLTQTTFGYSRDDAEGKFLTQYVERETLPRNPFVHIDEDGVGRLVRQGVELGRGSKPGLKAGICGEHGGDPESIDFCERVGLDYVSCSPYRVPTARLAAAQATLRLRSGETVEV